MIRIRVQDSFTLVEELKHKVDNNELGFQFDFTRLEKELLEMQRLEKVISITKKTVSKHQLLKRLRKMQDSLHFYLYQPNKMSLFIFISEQINNTIGDKIAEQMSAYASVGSVK